MSTAKIDWFMHLKWGVFLHYLTSAETTSSEWNQQVDGFDVNCLAKQLSDCGAKYCLISLGQNSGHFCSPNKTYDAFVEIQPSKCSQRDLVADLYKALEEYKIHLMVYLPSGAPDLDAIAMKKLQWQNGEQPEVYAPLSGLDESGKPWGWKNLPNLEFQRKWESVICEWSLRWGKNIHGWWFDGCYFAETMYRRKEHPNFESFAAAAKAGNPDSIVAFNPGVKIPIVRMTEFEDYTAGEISRSLPEIYGRFVDGAQLHVFSYLGNTWGSGQPRFSDGLVLEYTKYVISHQGVVTWDVPIEKSGRIPQEYLRQLAVLKNI